MTENKKEEKREKQRCNSCGSALIYIRLKSSQKCCRTCGFIENLKEKEEKKA